MRQVGALALLGMMSACWEHQRGYMALEDKEALTINAPTSDRCAKYKRGTAEASGCLEMRQTATEWTRHLNVGDEFCMDTVFGDEVNRNCKARGVLTDAGGDGFIIEIRDARTDSTWYAYNQRRIWYATSALVDSYLKERGYE